MASFGEELRRQRELRAISLREISDATKINIRFLEALEQNDFKHLPGGQFNKGFIRAYARHLGVDGEEMVDAYLLELRRQEGGASSSGRGSAPGRSGVELRRLPLLVLVTLLLLGGALAAWLLLAPRAASRGRSAAARTPTHAAGSSPPSTTPGGARAVPAPPETRSAPQPEAATGAPSSSSAATSDPPPGEGRAAASSGSVPQSSPASGAEPDASQQASRAAGGLILRVIPLQPVRFQLQCDGRSVLSGDLQVGRTFQFECPGVYEISAEDAGAVNVSVNGERIYLGRPGQSVAGRHVSAANYVDFTTPPSEGHSR